MLGFLSNLGMRAVTACKISLHSALVEVSKGAGIVFGSFTNSVSRKKTALLNLWFIFFQINILLAQSSPIVSGSEFVSFSLTLLMVAGVVVHTLLYNLPSTTLTHVYGWLSNRAKVLLVYFAVLGSLVYFFGPSFLVSLIYFRTFFGEVAKNLVETGVLNGIFPYGDLELGFIDIAGVYVLFQGFFISSSGLALLLQNSMFISLAFILVFPFCLGTGVLLEGMLLSVGFPLFQVSSPLPKDLPSIVRDLDKNLVVKYPNLEKLFVKQPKSFFPYMFKGPESTKLLLTPPHEDIVAAHERAACKVRGYLLNKEVVNVGEFIGSTEQLIKQMELSGRRLTPTESMLYYELVTRVSIYGVLVDPKTGHSCYDLSPEYRATIFLEDTHFKSDPLKVLGSTRVLVNSGNEVFGAIGHYAQNGEFLIRPETAASDFEGVELKTFSGRATTVKAASHASSNTYGFKLLVLAPGNIDYKGPIVDTTNFNLFFGEKSLLRPNIVTEALRTSATNLKNQLELDGLRFKHR